MPHNINDLNKQLELAEKVHNLRGADEWFEFQEGNNPVRIVTQAAVLAEKYKLGTVYSRDKGYPYDEGGVDEKGVAIPETRVKWLIWLIDRKDQKMKLAKLPHKVMKQLASLQQNEEYHFDGFPMPYDITINALNAGTKEVVYTLLPARGNTPLTPEEQAKIGELKSAQEIVDKMKEKQIKKHQQMGIWRGNQEPQKVEPALEYPVNNGEEIPW